MKVDKLIIRLALFVIPLALVAAAAGVFWQGKGSSIPFTTMHGETVMLRGHGLYFYDTITSSSQAIGQDVVTLIIGIPLMIAAVVLAGRGLLRGRLLLTGAFGYFLYTYAAMCFLAAFNPLFLVYVALFSLSLFGFILSLKGIDPHEVVAHVSERFPRRAVAIYFILVSAFLALAWLGLVVPPIFKGTPPVGLESSITLVIQALDLGVIVPTALLSGVLLLQKRPWGYTLAVVMILKILTMGAALIAMVIGQALAKVAIDPVTSVFFLLIGISGITLGVITLRTIQD
jgi:hypothetical protein